MFKPQAVSVFITVLTGKKVIIKLRRPMNNAWSKSYSSSTITSHYSRNRHLCCAHTKVFSGFTSYVCVHPFSVFSQVELC